MKEVATLTREEAVIEAQRLLDEKSSRSDVCSFLNNLESSGLMTSLNADFLADALVAFPKDAAGVLRVILRVLRKEGNP